MQSFHSRFTIVLMCVQPNILVDAAGHARITGFGLAMVAQNPDSPRINWDNQGQASRWTAPEILNEQGTYSKEADVFSYAMVVIEVRYGCVVFVMSLGLLPYHITTDLYRCGSVQW